MALVLYKLLLVLLVVDLFDLVGVGSAYELAFHVINVALGIHEVLVLFPFNLYGSQHLVVPHVHALFLVILSCVYLLIRLPISQVLIRRQGIALLIHEVIIILVDAFSLLLTGQILNVLVLLAEL